MATFDLKPEMSFKIKMTMTEEEARALDAIAGYGADKFLEFFYENMGIHYLKPHEEGLKTLFSSIREALPMRLGMIDKARNSVK